MTTWWLIGIVAFLAVTAAGCFILRDSHTGNKFSEDDIYSGEFRGN